MPSSTQNKSLTEAVELLAKGRLVAFPTETVYGLGADAASAEALELLYKVKRRPKKHPVIVHIASVQDLALWCQEVPQSALLLANLFWPGPLTLVLKKAPHVLDQVTGKQNTVALRIPGHPLALSLLQAFGRGIAAPSANKFGHLSATTAEAVQAEFGDELDLILDGGPCQVGIESTIVDLSSQTPNILRPGMIQAESIFTALAEIGITSTTASLTSTRQALPVVPGSLPSHYAPTKPLKLVSGETLSQELHSLKMHGHKPAVLSFKPTTFEHNNWIIASSSPHIYAHALYTNLRKLDHSNSDIILVEEPPADGLWTGIHDRLNRAATKTEERNGT